MSASLVGEFIADDLILILNPLGSTIGKSPRIASAQVHEVSGETVHELLPNADMCRQSQLAALEEVKDLLENKRVEIDFFVMEPKTFKDFDPVHRVFRLKRPRPPSIFSFLGEHGAHLVEEMGSRRLKHYQEFSAPALRLASSGGIGIGSYFMPASKIPVCVIASAKEIADALK